MTGNVPDENSDKKTKGANRAANLYNEEMIELIEYHVKTKKDDKPVARKWIIANGPLLFDAHRVKRVH